jgi:hypothetical protein
MKFYCKKNIKLAGADCHLHYANNKGRGRDNVTVTFVKTGTERPAFTRNYDKKDILEQYRVSGWRGGVNIYTADIKKYGGVVNS